MLYLRTFGGLAIERDGTALGGLAFRRRPLTLLAFIASHGDVGVARESVLADFWPESDVAHARNSLKQAVFALRRELGVDVFVPGAVTLRIDRGLLGSDALDLSDALDRDDMQAAVALYRGPFLDGVPMRGLHHLERWAEGERERFAWACARALEIIAAQATLGGDHAAAITAWRRRAALDPLSGHAAAGLMRALRDAGDATAALEYWRVHEMLVREELGVAPDPSVVSLAESLRDLTSMRAAPAGRAEPPPPASPTPVPEPVDAPTPSGLAPAAPSRLAARLARAPAPVVDRTITIATPIRPWWYVRPRVVRGLVVALLVAAAVPAAVRLTSVLAATPRATQASVVAVLPFNVRGLVDTTDAWLGKGVADLVSGAVHGAGEWNVVPPTALLADEVVSARPYLTAQESREVARRFGAGRYILGDVVRDGRRLYLAASLHDADGRVLAQAHAMATDGQLGEACGAIVQALLAPPQAPRAAGARAAR